MGFLFYEQLLECLYLYIGKHHGYGKRSVRNSIMNLVMRSEEETKWWKAVQKRCKTIVGEKTSMSQAEFKSVVCLDVSKNGRHDCGS